MAKNIFSEWDKNIDTRFLDEIEATDGNKIPHGVYECTLGGLEVGLSKSNKPMLKVRFNIVNDKRSIFVNQIIEKPFQVSLAKKLLNSMDTDVKVVFESYTQFNELCAQIKQSAEELKLSFEVNYGEEKGYDKVEITNVFEN